MTPQEHLEALAAITEERLPDALASLSDAMADLDQCYVPEIAMAIENARICIRHLQMTGAQWLQSRQAPEMTYPYADAEAEV
jgi:hypothetical protein